MKDLVAVTVAAVRASEVVPDRRLAATAWNNLGIALRHQHSYADAVTAHKRAADMFDQEGDHL